MDYYTPGNVRLRVGQLALGTLLFGDDWGCGTDESNSQTLLDQYLEAGGNFIDTANIHYLSHED